MEALFLVRLRVVAIDSNPTLTFTFDRILVLLEWMISYGLGRPSSIHDEEYVFCF